MGDNTTISWTTATWNPWYGCKKVSQGCKNCYAERDMERYGKSFTLVHKSTSTFRDPLKWKEPRKVFTCSWSDFFIPEADYDWRKEAWDIIKATPHLTYQILTKRPENIKARLPVDWGQGYPNCWLGVSVENQKAADERIPLLMDIPASVRFLSCEPLLEQIDLTDYLWDERQSDTYESHFDPLTGQPRGRPTTWKVPNGLISWAIIGGESGPNRREMKDEWAVDLVNQCKEAGVAVWFKQHSGLRPGTEPTLQGVEYHEWPKGYENATKSN